MTKADRRTPSVPQRLLNDVAELVRQRTGLEFPESSRGRLRSAVRAALHADAADDAGRLLRLLEADPERVKALAAATTIAESYFFRDPAQFAWLRGQALPPLCARPVDEPLRIWCAGCAGGEEPYSMAILLREMGYQGTLKIVGSDLSPQSLERARTATYSRWAMRTAATDVVSRWFTRRGGEYVLKDDIRDAVTFVGHNLAADIFPPGGSGMQMADLILCRNVLIYFDDATVRRMAQQFVDALSPDGWLLLGASDPPIGELVPCDVVVTNAGLAYRRPTARVGAESPVFDGRPAPSPGDAGSHAQIEALEAPASAADDSAPAPVRLPAPARGVPAEDPQGTLLSERYEARDFRGAVAVAERVLQSQPAAEFAWLALVRALANLGDFVEAGRASALAAERCPLSAELMYLAAVIQANAGQHAQAAAAARRALYLDHTMIVAHVALAAALRIVGDESGASRATDNALQLLGQMDPIAPVPGADGESAGVMLALVRTGRRQEGAV